MEEENSSSVRMILLEEYQRLIRLLKEKRDRELDYTSLVKKIEDFNPILEWLYPENKNNRKKRVLLESPYAGDVERNIKYARACVRDSLLRGEAPIASHLLYTQDGILDDNIEEERMHGINAGLAWKGVADLHVFYIDYGISKGMQYAIDYAIKNKIPIEKRKIL